jgi:translation initiation factor 1 (eIF-1/SUI1)
MTDQILNFNNNNLDFDDENNNNDNKKENELFDDPRIYIVLSKRNARKSYTSIYNLNTKYDYIAILKTLKNKCSTNGSIKLDKETKLNYIQINGIHTMDVIDFFLEEDIADRKHIRVKSQ